MKLIDRLERDFPDASRQARKLWLRSGRVKVEGRVEKNAVREVADGARVSLTPKAAAQPFGAAAKKLRVLYEDGTLIALDKPPGLLTVPTHLLATKDSLQYRVVRYLQGKGQQALVVHRLDRKTTGIVIFAKSEQAREKLKNQFAERTVVRKYVARVWGKVSQSQGELRDWLLEGDDLMVRIVPAPAHAGRGPGARSSGSAGTERPGERFGASRFSMKPRYEAHGRDDGEGDEDDEAPPSRRPVRTGAADAPQPKEAITRYRVSAREPETTLLAISIKTGRRAQIRVQLAAIGHPIVGDHLYGRGAKPADRMHLHASGLEFVHPGSGQIVKLESPLPTDLMNPPPEGSAPPAAPARGEWVSQRARPADRYGASRDRDEDGRRPGGDRRERRPDREGRRRRPDRDRRDERGPRAERRPAGARPEADRRQRPGERAPDSRGKRSDSGGLRFNKPRRPPPRKFRP